jgi:hypothetical protein
MTGSNPRWLSRFLQPLNWCYSWSRPVDLNSGPCSSEGPWAMSGDSFGCLFMSLSGWRPGVLLTILLGHRTAHHKESLSRVQRNPREIKTDFRSRRHMCSLCWICRIFSALSVTLNVHLPPEFSRWKARWSEGPAWRKQLLLCEVPAVISHTELQFSKLC